MMKPIGLTALAIFTTAALAGGNPEFVGFPAGYQDDFTRYHVQNRANNKQVAEMYANDIALKSVKTGKLEAGSVIIMEVYKPVVDDDGNPAAGSDGLFEKAKLAAVAVMERRNDWSAEFSADDRTDGWGYALYDPSGAPKENDLDCVSCHAPLAGQEFMFSFDQLSAH